MVEENKFLKAELNKLSPKEVIVTKFDVSLPNESEVKFDEINLENMDESYTESIIKDKE